MRTKKTLYLIGAVLSTVPFLTYLIGSLSVLSDPEMDYRVFIFGMILTAAIWVPFLALGWFLMSKFIALSKEPLEATPATPLVSAKHSQHKKIGLSLIAGSTVVITAYIITASRDESGLLWLFGSFGITFVVLPILIVGFVLLKK